MICPACKRKISKDDKFCGYCGSRVNFKEEEKSDYPEVPDEYRVEYIGHPQKQDRQKRHTNIIHIFYKHWKPALFIIITFLVLWSIISDGGFGTREFPQLAEPKTVTFEWKYNDSNYLMTETFYKTVYDYYNSNPDKHYLQEEDYRDYLKRFLEEAEEDNTISKIASRIKTISSKDGLRDDELLEFTVAFVQSIPYDEDRFELVMYSNKPEDLYPRYPYEVLYDNKGVCSGKSFLAVSLIKELDYGVALFNYDPIVEGEVGHIVPAVKCPKGYSSYNSGYCYTETVETGFKIGDIPIDIDTGIPKARTPIKLFEEESVFGFDGLEDAEIYVIADGNSYQGIIETVQTIQKIETLESEITRLYWVIISLDEEANQLENSVNYYEQQSEAAYRRHELLGDYTSYNEYLRLHSQYESVYARYESKLNEYNKEVDQYNDLAYKYNALIEDFYE